MFATSKVMIFVAILIASLLYWATSNVCRYNFTIEKKTNQLNIISQDEFPTIPKAKVYYYNELNCNEFKKLSSNYMKCKANLIKDKTVSAGKNFIDDTKNYQNKEWSDEKSKLNSLKEKITEK